MNPVIRALGILVCLFWSYAIVDILIGIIYFEERALSFLWVPPLGGYLLLLILPYLILLRYPSWVRKIIPDWLINCALTDYLKNFNTKPKDLQKK